MGKSSLINMISGKKNLARISATPGKTRLINHYELRTDSGPPFYFVDLPGYGYARLSQKARNNWQNMIESYIRKRENLACLFVLIDSRHEPQSIDLSFIDQLGVWERPFALVFTKTDKNKPGATRRHADAFLAAMQERWEAPPPFFLTSSLRKEGRQEIVDFIGGILSKDR